MPVLSLGFTQGMSRVPAGSGLGKRIISYHKGKRKGKTFRADSHLIVNMAQYMPPKSHSLVLLLPKKKIEKGHSIILYAITKW